MKSDKTLGTIQVKPYEPKTAKPGEEVKRKKELRDFIIENISDLIKIKNTCRDKERVSIDVCFNLFDGQKNDESRYTKDLDNLLKIVLDVLPDYMDNKKEHRESGLGIIKNDNQVFEIHSYKNFVQDPYMEGIEIIISEYDLNFDL